MATEAPITREKNWFKGTDVKLRWTLSPVESITGWTIEFKLAPAGGGDPVLTKACAPDNEEGGVYSASIADTDTDEVEAGTYLYETRRTDDGNKAVLSFGPALLRRGATG